MTGDRDWEERREGGGPDLKDSQPVLGAVEAAGHSEGVLCSLISHGCQVAVGHRVRREEEMRGCCRWTGGMVSPMRVAAVNTGEKWVKLVWLVIERGLWID